MATLRARLQSVRVTLQQEQQRIPQGGMRAWVGLRHAVEEHRRPNAANALTEAAVEEQP